MCATIHPFPRFEPGMAMVEDRMVEGIMDETIRYALGATWLGTIVVACTDGGVACLTLGDEGDRLVGGLLRRFRGFRLVEGGADSAGLVSRATQLVEEPWAEADLPLDLRGTPFQLQVWQALRAVPAGRTASYGEIADRIGRPTAARAVALACGANPVAVLVPCHRIVRQDGSRSGYRWGVERKQRLLEREAAAVGLEAAGLRSHQHQIIAGLRSDCRKAGVRRSAC